ncbi:hypothetical protein LTR48_001218 [Friedmanniomyces endolithicus]|nr:hypothetical protein LTR48_001218 [Friedmanniomyces endolithicus]
MASVVAPTQEETKQLRRVPDDLPPTPPDSDTNSDTEKCETDDALRYVDADVPLPPPTHEPTEVLEPDKKTPDNWLPRDPRLIRLTGVHPFNTEPPLSDLYNEGFLTSPDLFYVRNHGAVPQVHDEDIPDWEFSIEGLVEHPFKLTLRDLIEQYEQKTYPVTLVCAGNRRKEQNVVRKTKGFSWGAAGVSTALFTGVILGDLLRKAKPKRGGRYVCMEGADKLPNGYYGTSVKLNWAMDPNRGMMLAHRMNGEMLRPDHGKPLRAVIPGQIGGRSVKWLKKLIITAEPSDNWYHIYDNRVLPTTVSPEESANNPKWWIDERYAIYDLSTNSATAYPAHEEQLCLVDSPPNYRVKGYAYAGGGRRITRVEVTLDKGKSWRLAKIDYAEDRYREQGPRQMCGGELDMEWRESSFYSETAKAMMRDYHIGTLDPAGRAALASAEVQPDPLAAPSPLFLDARTWKKGTLHAKTSNSWDTKTFTFRLEHAAQTLGLPTGQHLMLRLRDPVTREAIIRSYTPISETSAQGFLDVLVKIYFDTAERKGGKMSQALDQLPIGRFVDFKGPIGKFEYRGRGLCSVNGRERKVKRFLMVCGGSGITPIYQVFRAVMRDREDATECVLLSGNRGVEDILCKAELDGLVRENESEGEGGKGKGRVLYTLTQAPEGWEGLRGRIGETLLREQGGREGLGEGEGMVLVCGPEPLEKSVREALVEIGWRDDEMLFF